MVNTSGGELCRGVLLGPSSVLTAASCLYAVHSISGILVIHGIHPQQNIIKLVLRQNVRRLGGCRLNFRVETKNNINVTTCHLAWHFGLDLPLREHCLHPLVRNEWDLTYTDAVSLLRFVPQIVGNRS